MIPGIYPFRRAIVAVMVDLTVTCSASAFTTGYKAMNRFKYQDTRIFLTVRYGAEPSLFISHVSEPGESI